MKKFFILACIITAFGCSSTDNIKIISPSTPESEAKQEIREAPITRLETSSKPPDRHEATQQGEAVEEGHKTDNIKIVSPSAPEKETEEEIRKVPMTQRETATQPPSGRRATEAQEAASVSPVAPAATAPAQAASPASLNSPRAVEALINLLEKKGVIQEEELLQEIQRLEGKDER